MNPATLRALDLFDRFVTLTGAARKAALDTLAEEEPDAHRALRRLLATDLGMADHVPLLDAFRDVADSPLFRDAEEPATRIGERLGSWRLTGVLGSGGMGTVYEAQRADGQYHQRVALKCIRQDLSSPRVIEGFLRERDILASLDHPGIVSLMDGGVDDAGRPWFAMRHVQGTPIDAWCDQRSASVRERVAMLAQACDALAHAHAAHVLHQDIKPSNLLVTDSGDVQLLDFGLSVSLAAPYSTQRLAVSHAYAAPEALASVAPTVAADIWSLGMVMYRLLAGTLPRTRSQLMMVAGDGSAVPVAASLSRLAAAMSTEDARRRGCRHAGALARHLAGDLNAIARRCIAQDPAARYGSVRALHDDLRAWLDRRPVSARPDSWAYRSGRFLARHRIPVGLAGVLALTVAGSIGGVAWKREQATHAARAAQAMASVFEQTLGTATLSGLGETPISSHSLLRQTEQRVRALPLADHPDVLAQGLGMLARNHAVIGDYARATALAREAAALPGEDATSARSQATLAALLNLQGKPAEAERVARAALTRTATDEPTSARRQLLTESARARWHLADHDQARALLDAALDEALAADDSAAQAELRTQRALWNIRLQRFAAAGADAQRAIALATPRHPLLANEARRIAAHNLVMQERLPEARTTIDRVLADYRARLGESHPLVGRTWRVVAGLRCSGGELDACEDALDRASDITLRLYGDRHPEHAELLQIRALLLGLRGRHDEGMALLRHAETLLRAAYPEDHNSVQHVRFMIARRLLYFPQVSPQPRQQQLAEVIERMEAVHASFARVGLPLRPLDRMALADALQQRSAPGDLARARRVLDDNAATLRAFPPTYSVYYRNDYDRARLAYLDNDTAAADRLLAPVTEALETYLDRPERTRTHSTLSTDNNRRTLCLAYALRAALLARNGERGQARALLQRASDSLAKARGIEDGFAERAHARLVAFDRTGDVMID
ncbi:serine/threonine-protein kinase [Pseudoxanthomonas sp. LH2527]|uniref:serine/threonine-protein kinase n=1 Tax=Pseudoxanthomonas sp. LH2527 TaxID=2923249 RepID=UPI001F140592|nr:serine/threonine-protein kinase [Pseudoxanthomonas sp. LH2527]MCH6485060.1 serine/threonine-protein kinase [Pseudoxanthomonas sp. LH2527]